eukprot:1161693-Pelagomonas_calceolata.AAC.4
MPARYGPLLTYGGHRNRPLVAEVDSKRFTAPSWGENNYTILEHSLRMWHLTFSVQLVSCHYAFLHLTHYLQQSTPQEGSLPRHQP